VLDWEICFDCEGSRDETAFCWYRWVALFSLNPATQARREGGLPVPGGAEITNEVL